jgi:hypothetical protein
MTSYRTYTEAPAPVYCPACRDALVDCEGDVCQPCRESAPDDWTRGEDYAEMVRLARLSDAIREAVQ